MKLKFNHVCNFLDDETEEKLSDHAEWYSSLKSSGKQLVVENKTISNIKLSGRLLSGAVFRNVDFVNAKFDNLVLNCATFENVSFISSLISYSSFDNAIINHCTFSNSTIACCHSRRGLFGVSFIDTKMNNVEFIFNELGGTMNNVDFDGSCLFTNSRFNKTIFNNVTGLPKMRCPETGSFIGWKKLYHDCSEYIVKLEIPEDAKRASGISNKCRCSKAKVLGIYTMSGKKSKKRSVTNTFHTPLTYKINEVVYPDEFDDNRWNECSHGIHFFMTRKEAMEYKV